MRRGGKISKGAAAVVDAFLASRPGPRLRDRPAANLALTVRHLCGAASAEDSRFVEAGLARDSQARATARRALQCLDEIRLRPLDEAARSTEGFEAEVASEYLAVISEQLSASRESPGLWLARGWHEVRRLVVEGSAASRVAWNAFVASLRQARISVGTPGFAPARDGEHDRPSILGELPDGVHLQVARAEIGEDQALLVSIRVTGEDGNPSEALSGKRLGLWLDLDGDLYPLGSRVVEADKTEWIEPGFGAALGIPPFEIPPGSLRLGLGGVAPEVAARRSVRVQTHPQAKAIHVDLYGAPSFGSGRFAAKIAIPAAVRAAYPAHLLGIDLMISADAWQRIGAWPVEEWGDEALTIDAPCPGMPDAVLSYLSSLRISLLPALR